MPTPHYFTYIHVNRADCCWPRFLNGLTAVGQALPIGLPTVTSVVGLGIILKRTVEMSLGFRVRVKIVVSLSFNPINM